MEKYYMNRNEQSDTKDFEVHRSTWSPECPHPALPENRLDLWWHSNCGTAVKKAKETYTNVAHRINWCYWCSRECHTT